MTQCGIFINDDPICEDRIAECFDWNETGLQQFIIKSSYLSYSSFRTFVDNNNYILY